MDKSDKFSSLRQKLAEYAYCNGLSKTGLDIATGFGYQAVALKKIGVEKVFAIDLVQTRIDYCKKQWPDSGVNFQVMDAAHMDFPDKYFDCVTISVALHDMPTEVKRAVITEIARVTKRIFVFVEPRTFKKGFKAFFYGMVGSVLDELLNFRDYVYDDMGKLLNDNGFRIIKDELVWHNILNIKACEPAK